MNFRNVILLILQITSINNSLGQGKGQEIIAKFIITDATKNGIDITPTLIENNAYTAFYKSDRKGSIYMANIWPKSRSQSYGPMYSIKSHTNRETYETYEADVFYFNWRYINTYDGKKGTAKVQVIKIYKPQGVVFVLKMITENLDLIIYKGYMEGTVDFSKF
ncbi:MAG: hypothetical protein NBV77_05770 [Bacteroidia bacterium]|nr:hypothetical protein [Bacteroidia bacterium]